MATKQPELFEEKADRQGIEYKFLGKTNGDKYISIERIGTLSMEILRAARESWLPEFMVN